MFMPRALPVSVERDYWDWFLYSVSLAAAISAILVFLPWALERRRRPEARIIWEISSTGDPGSMVPWPPDHVPEITPGQVLYVRVGVLNVGDRAGEATLVNFVVPDCFDLRKYFDREAKASLSSNPTAGLPPDYRVAYFDPRPEPWTPGNWFACTYQITCSPGESQERSQQARLLFDVSDSRFNRTGRRWLPSFLPPDDLGHAMAGEEWPPRSRRPRLGLVRVAPRRIASARDLVGTCATSQYGVGHHPQAIPRTVQSPGFCGRHGLGVGSTGSGGTGIGSASSGGCAVGLEGSALLRARVAA